jgi:hypothetical protein
MRFGLAIRLLDPSFTLEVADLLHPAMSKYVMVAG